MKLNLNFIGQILGDEQQRKNLGFYLELSGACDLTCSLKYTLKIRKQKGKGKESKKKEEENEKKAEGNCSENSAFGWSDFVLLGDLYDEQRGYIVDDTLEFYDQVEKKLSEVEQWNESWKESWHEFADVI